MGTSSFPAAVLVSALASRESSSISVASRFCTSFPNVARTIQLLLGIHTWPTKMSLLSSGFFKYCLDRILRKPSFAETETVVAFGTRTRKVSTEPSTSRPTIGSMIVQPGCKRVHVYIGYIDVIMCVCMWTQQQHQQAHTYSGLVSKRVSELQATPKRYICYGNGFR